MKQQIESLKQSQLTQVLADGFALLYHRKPKFPVTYLANYLKNYQYAQKEKKHIGQKLSHNRKLIDQMNKKQQQIKNKQKEAKKIYEKKDEQQKDFLKRIQSSQYHQDILDEFCNWIQKRFNLTGAYIGQLKNKKKVINLAQQDSQQAHFDAEAPKIIYFQHCSNSHRDIILNKTLPQESVLGKLLTGGTGEGQGQQPPAQGEDGAPKQVKPKDQIFFNSVVDNKQLHFFKFPRLGSFFGIGVKINSYLSHKIFDQNLLKVSTFQKQFEQYQKLRQQRQEKFKVLYQQKQNSGEGEQQLQNLQKQFQKQEANFQKPKLKQFDTIKREFVFGFDTLGQDRQINKQDQIKIKQYVNFLKKCWQNTELEALKVDIDRHLKLADKIQAPHQQTYLKIIGEQDRQVASNEQVQKYKSNQKLMELEMDTLRIQKLKQYLADQKYQPFLQQILKSKTLKFQQIIKFWLIFTGKKKQDINYPGTNVVDYRKIRPLLSKNQFINSINNTPLRGAKPDVDIKNYAKWQRQQRNMQKLQASNISSFNIYLAFILRYLQLAAKIRKADRIKRIDIMKQQRKGRAARKRQNTKKDNQRQSKMQAARVEAEQKQEPFDQNAWLAQYLQAQQNQLIQVGPKIPDEIDKDLQNGQQIFPEEQEPAQNAENPPPQ